MRIVLVIASYLVGSIPTGYLLVRLSGNKDVRELGSGSTGATNVLRVKGWKTALPVAAVDILKDKIVHCHMKDATWSKEPTKTWGEEVVLGTGQASIPKLVGKLRSFGYKGPLVIEREAGDQRIADIKTAIGLLESVVG